VHTALIPNAANREAEGTGVVEAVDGAAVVVQDAAPGMGPGRDGGRPPTSAVGHVVEISIKTPPSYQSTGRDIGWDRLTKQLGGRYQKKGNQKMINNPQNHIIEYFQR